MVATCTQMNSFLEKAELNSHALLGDSKSTLQNVFSHAVGYAATPFSYLVDALVPTSDKARADQQRYAIEHAYQKSLVGKPKVVGLKAHHGTRPAPNYRKFFEKRKVYMPNQRKKNIAKAVSKVRLAAAKSILKRTKKRGPKARAMPRLRRARAGKVPFGSRRRLVQSTIRMPVSTGHVLNTGPNWTFKVGRRPGCIVMTGRIRLGEFVTNPDGALALSNSTVGAYAAWPIAPFLTLYYRSPLSDIAKLFDRYEMECAINTVNQCSTSTPGKYGICIVRDAAAVNDVLNIAGDSDVINLADLSGNSTLRECSAYGKMKTVWFKALSQDDMKFVSGTFLPGDNVTWNSSSAGIRDQIQGAFVFASAGLTPSLPIADVFMNFKLELCDVMAPPTHREALSNRRATASSIDKLSKNADRLLALLDATHEDEKSLEKRSTSRDSARSVKLPKLS
jgi:hypothetical protein